MILPGAVHMEENLSQRLTAKLAIIGSRASRDFRPSLVRVLAHDVAPAKKEMERFQFYLPFYVSSGAEITLKEGEMNWFESASTLFSFFFFFFRLPCCHF